MKKIWYLYKNYFNIGQAPTQVKALKALEIHAEQKMKTPTNKLDESLSKDVYTSSYIKICTLNGIYEARKEEMK